MKILNYSNFKIFLYFFIEIIKSYGILLQKYHLVKFTYKLIFFLKESSNQDYLIKYKILHISEVIKLLNNKSIPDQIKNIILKYLLKKPWDNPIMKNALNLKYNEYDALFVFIKESKNKIKCIKNLKSLYFAYFFYYLKFYLYLKKKNKKIIEINLQALETTFDKKKNEILIFHDIHAWDIIPSMAIILANNFFNYKTYFFISFNQNPFDKLTENLYKIFNFFNDQVHIGLHANPATTYFESQISKGNVDEYLKIFKTKTALKKVDKILQSTEETKIQIQINKIYEKIEKHFSEEFFNISNIMSLHGDPPHANLLKFNKNILQKSNLFTNRFDNLKSLLSKEKVIISLSDSTKKGRMELKEKIKIQSSNLYLNHPQIIFINFKKFFNE